MTGNDPVNKKTVLIDGISLCCLEAITLHLKYGGTEDYGTEVVCACGSLLKCAEHWGNARNKNIYGRVVN
jgi:hypothetical protein